MSVATKNPFALLGADESVPSSNPDTTPTPAPAAPTPRGGANKNRGGPAARGGKYYPRGGGTKSAAPPQEETPAGGERPKRNFDGESRARGRGRGRGGPRGPRGAGGGGRLDRHSGTGKVDSEKKVSQGWGGEDGNAELKAEEGATVDATAEGDAWGGEATAAGDAWGGEATAADDAWGGATTPAGDDPWAAPNASDEPAAGADDSKAEARRAREREQEEEDNTLTLDQYLAQKAEQEVSLVPKLEGVRQANEGGDDSLWKDVVPLQRGDDDDAYFVGKVKSAPKTRAKKEEKVYLDIDARFDRPERPGRGGRGGRGSDRGRGDRPGRGRGEGRGGRANGGQAVNVDDENAFPSLSYH